MWENASWSKNVFSQRSHSIIRSITSTKLPITISNKGK